MSDLNRLLVPQRQAPLGVAILFVQNLRRAINIFLAVVVVNLGRDFSILGLNYWDWGYIIALIFLVFSYFQYRRFFFYVQEENFIIEKGVFKQEKLSVPFARIQSVNTRQNVVQRLLNLVGLKVDTAGSIQQEIVISALSKAYAKELQEFLMEQKYAMASTEGAEEIQLEEAEQRLNASVKSKPLLSIDFPMLLKVGLTQNHLRSGLLLFAIVNGYVWQYEDYLLKPLEPYLEETAESLLTSWVLLLPVVFLVFAIISVISSLTVTILTFFNFKFYLEEKGLEIESGLLARNTYHLPYSKIQYFVWATNPLQRILKFRTLKVKQAGAEALNEKKLIGVPGLQARGLLKILDRQYPDRKQYAYVKRKPHVLKRNQYFFWFGLLPILSITGLFIYNQMSWWFYLPLSIWPTAVFFWAHAYWQAFQLRYNQDYLEIRRGYFFPKTILIPAYKIQNLSLSQSILQKDRGIASIRFHTAAGAVRAAHLDMRSMRELYDLLLQRVESSTEKWM